MTKSLLFVGTFALLLWAKPATSSSFPTTFIPFTSIATQTTSPSGDLLILGYTSSGTQTGVNAFPLPASVNEVFTNALVQLAPSQYFSNVYVPTAAERTGDYSSFAGTLIDPLTGAPFAQNVIPASELFGNNGLYAIRIGPQTAEAVPEPTTLGLLSLAGFVASYFRLRHRKTN